MVNNSTFCVHIILNASSLLKLSFDFEVSVESHAAVRNDGETCVPCTQFPSMVTVGNHSKCGKCGSAPTQKTSGEKVWRAGPTSMDRFSSGKSGLHCILTAMRLALAKTPSPWGSKCLLSIFIFLKSGLDLPGMEQSRLDHFSFYIANVLLWCIQPHPLLCLQKITTQNKALHSKGGPSLM